ncbi:putative nucleotidyltransferase with HDIG domain [Natranaerovirga pectinivora]|uniref:Putative nucleotidyltransferase with HDIG domain n=1 Tax=Natranaerovirga pectinivora TaxID=682400 RepID=A0A4R3MQP2_9FIRM|nr:HDIG domain-containing metalloprotein [Natranaerovirga pectinivora]TCT17222.1 putative nucleotidyltransferase with HDIG domain [Natranaerovirga pectinivora]
MRQDIIDSLKDEVKRRCESEDNYFGFGGYYHIKAVVKNASFLAESYGADIEVATIGAWLHDIASITDYNFYEELRHYSVDEGIEFVRNKLIRSYNKLSDESKEVYRDKYEAVMKILD